MRHLIYTAAGGIGVEPLFADVDEDHIRTKIAAAGGVIIADQDLESREVWSVVDELRRRPFPINVVASWG